MDEGDDINRYISSQEFASESFREERVRSATQWYWRLKNIIPDEQFKNEFLLTDTEFEEMKVKN